MSKFIVFNKIFNALLGKKHDDKKMRVIVTRLTDKSLMNYTASYTTGRSCNVKDDKWYSSKHSMIRSQIFLIEMINIPSFVSVHFRTHSVGIVHYVKSNRIDRGGTGKEDRYTPVNHAMILNAESLMNLSYKRLCTCASKETREVMQMIVDNLDDDLKKYTVPMCVYRNGKCDEFNPCGKYKFFYKSKDVPELNVVQSEFVQSEDDLHGLS